MTRPSCGAFASKGGKSIIASRSTAAKGKVSRIVARLDGPVTTPRIDTQYVVTEFGAANLKGLSSTERAKALISLAHPTFRDELAHAAKQLHLVWEVVMTIPLFRHPRPVPCPRHHCDDLRRL
jgi:itaconate CoA-transferase